MSEGATMARPSRLRRAATNLVALGATAALLVGCNNPASIDQSTCHRGADSLDELMSEVAMAGVAHDPQRACEIVPEGWAFRGEALRGFGRALDGNADLRWVVKASFGMLTEYTLTDPDGVELTNMRVLVAQDGRYFALLGTEPSK